MRWTTNVPKLADMRVRSKFAFLPIVHLEWVGGDAKETIAWLEFYKVEERYEEVVFYVSGSRRMRKKWVFVKYILGV